MRKRGFSLIIISTVIIIFICGCKKYEDGPLLSLRSKKARLVGIWKFKEVIINGEDRTNEYQYDNIGFERSGGAFYLTYDPKTDSEASLFGNWEFANNKEDLNINLSTEVEDTLTGSTSNINMYYRFKIKELHYLQIKLEGTSEVIYSGKQQLDNIKWTLHQ